MAGSISLSLSQQFNSLGRPLAGGLLYFYQAGTVATPQNAYQDSALTIPHSNPLTLDAAGRVPQLFFADGSIKIYLTDSTGVPQVSADNVLVVGPSSGSGSGSAVDPTTILQPGWIQPIYGTGVVSGFVRANGRTMGNAASGATERANADTLALFTFLYNADANLSVSGGRGVSAAVDYAANKTITLPDCRGRSISGLDDMGNSAAGRLTATYFGSAATTLGAAGGAESHTLALTELPAGITSTGTATGISGGGLRVPVATASESDLSLTPSGSGTHVPSATGWTFSNSLSGSASVTSSNTGAGAHTTVGPRLLATIYIKL